MDRRGYGTELIVDKIREAEYPVGQGMPIKLVCKQIGVTKKAYYRWRTECNGQKTMLAKRLKELESENARIMRLLAEAHLDKVMLQAVNTGNF